MQNKINRNLYENEIKKPIIKPTDDDNRFVEEKIRNILDSEAFNKEAFNYCTGWISEKERIGYIRGMLERQYVDNICSIFKHKDKIELIDFLNRVIMSRKIYKEDGCPQSDVLTPDELEEFKRLAADTDKIPKDTLAETAPVLTANSFLKMCRIVYDATSLWKYPDDISAEYIFIEARMNAETIGEGILGIDPDSPEAFAKTFYGIYHREELWFGGPKLYIHDESAKLGERLYSSPKIFGKWTGCIYCDNIGEHLYKGVKMYIALRKNGYPIYISDYEQICQNVQKCNYQTKYKLFRTV